MARQAPAAFVPPLRCIQGIDLLQALKPFHRYIIKNAHRAGRQPQALLPPSKNFARCAPHPNRDCGIHAGRDAKPYVPALRSKKGHSAVVLKSVAGKGRIQCAKPIGCRFSKPSQRMLFGQIAIQTWRQPFTRRTSTIVSIACLAPAEGTGRSVAFPLNTISFSMPCVTPHKQESACISNASSAYVRLLRRFSLTVQRQLDGNACCQAAAARFPCLSPLSKTVWVAVLPCLRPVCEKS